MQLRKLFLLLGFLSLVVSRSVFALGLGDIKLNSSLNEPLDAHISLIDIGELGADQIVVKLADQEDFRRLGIERSFFYTQLRFTTVTNRPGGPFIAVTSKDPVREPFLSFVVEVRWTSGRLLREYTVLLDLPVFSDEQAQPIEATATPVRQPSSSVKSEPVRTAPEPAAVPANRSSSSDVYGPVKANDTLWEIARSVRPGRASIQQTMLAIQRANPDAFINNNINLLRKGQVLRIPSADEVNSLTNRQAISQVARQNRDWSGNAMGAQLDASGRGSSIDRSASEVRGQVKLAAPGTTGDSGTAQGGGYGSSNTGQLASELAAAEEELQRSRSDNEDLRSRVTDLEDQIETMERLLEVSNEQLSALQAASANTDNSASQDVSQSQDTEAPAVSVEAPTADNTASSEASLASSPVAAQSSEPAEAPAAVEEERKVNKVVRRTPEPSLMDKIMANIYWLGLAVIGLIVAVFVILRKRSGGAEPQEEFTSEFNDAVFEEADAEAGEQGEDSAEEDDDLDTAFTDEEADLPVEAETGDVVSEADIFIALRNFDRAERMLLNGLEKEPQSEPIKLKLLEVYAESNNLSAFDEHYQQLRGFAGAQALEQAKELRVQLAGEDAPEASAQSIEESADEFDELSMELADDSDDLEALGLGESEADSSDDELSLEDDFDFELDDELTGEQDETPATDELELEGAATSYDMSFDEDGEGDDQDDLLDFDLDDDGQGAVSDAESVEGAATSQAEPSLDEELDLDGILTDETDDSGELGSIDFEPVGSLDGDTESDEADELTLDLDDAVELDAPDVAGEELSLDDLEFDLGEEEKQDDSAGLGDDADLDFDLDSLDGDLDSEDEPTKLTDDAPLLDEDLDFSTGESFEEPEVEMPEYSSPAPYAPADEASVSLESDAADIDDDFSLDEDAPTLDLADDDADDFDLDQAMGDVDLEALDKEMSDLDEMPDLDSLDLEQEETAPEVAEEVTADAIEELAEPVADLSEEMPELTEEDALTDLSVADDDDAFDAALADVEDGLDLDDLPTPESVNEAASDEEDLDFLADADEVATKLDLARAYIDMGDMEGAKDILAEVSEEGNDDQKEEAKGLLEKVDQ